jgi:hypothetical protein
VSHCYLGVVTGFFMIPCLMVVGCGEVMFGGVLMMLGGFPMMFGALFRHVNPFS